MLHPLVEDGKKGSISATQALWSISGSFRFKRMRNWKIDIPTKKNLSVENVEVEEPRYFFAPSGVPAK
jgi:hypothetical protein